MTQARYTCRFHPTEFFHEVGCPHRTWAISELESAVETAKESQKMLSHGGDKFWLKIEAEKKAKLEDLKRQLKIKLKEYMA